MVQEVDSHKLVAEKHGFVESKEGTHRVMCNQELDDPNHIRVSGIPNGSKVLASSHIDAELVAGQVRYSPIDDNGGHGGSPKKTLGSGNPHGAVDQGGSSPNGGDPVQVPSGTEGIINSGIGSSHAIPSATVKASIPGKHVVSDWRSLFSKPATLTSNLKFHAPLMVDGKLRVRPPASVAQAGYVHW